jgi:hypothetical protein
MFHTLVNVFGIFSLLERRGRVGIASIMISNGKKRIVRLKKIKLKGLKLIVQVS